MLPRPDRLCGPTPWGLSTGYWIVVVVAALMFLLNLIPESAMPELGRPPNTRPRFAT